MRVLFFFIAFVIGAATSTAQKKLKRDVDSNGDTLYYTSEVKIYNKPGSRNAVGEYLKSSVYKTVAGYKLCLSIQTGRTNVFTIARGASAQLTLGDGTVVSLSSNNNHTARGSSLAYGSFIFSFYPLSTSDLRALKNSRISFIRVQASTGEMDYEIREKFQETIGEQVEKILEG